MVLLNVWHFVAYVAVKYAVSQNKTPAQSFCDNFGKYGQILIILLPLKF